MNEKNKNNQDLRRDVRRQTIGYIMAAFGLIAGLAWNDAIKGLINYLFPFAGGSLIMTFIYAVILTVTVVFLGRFLNKQV